MGRLWAGIILDLELEQFCKDDFGFASRPVLLVPDPVPIRGPSLVLESSSTSFYFYFSFSLEIEISFYPKVQKGISYNPVTVHTLPSKSNKFCHLRN